MAIREHELLVLKNEFGRTVGAKCRECGMELGDPREWHEPECCLLFKNGFDPHRYVHRAAGEIPGKPDLSYGNHPSVKRPLAPVESL